MVVNFGVCEEGSREAFGERAPDVRPNQNSEPILLREERELGGIGNGTSTPRQGG